MVSDSGRSGRRNKVSGNDGGLFEALQRFWVKSYAGDYLGFSILATAFLLIQFFSEPFHQQFRLDDPRIQHPHAEVERVPFIWLFIYAAITPAFVLAIWFLTFPPSRHKAHVAFLGLGVSVVSTLFLTDLFKDAIGRPRPDLVARCKPGPNTSRTQHVGVAECTQSDAHTLHDGWRSYPSGHSSFAFAGLGWLALFLASQTHALRPRASLAVVLVCAAPLLLAALIAVSRLEDYRHDVFDVVSGSLLGFGIAWFHWRRYFPRLTSAGCDEPHAPPSSPLASSARGSPGMPPFQRVRDEEEGHLRDTSRYSTGDDGARYGSSSG